MSLKSAIKQTLVGPPGERTHFIRHGLLKGLRFNLDTTNFASHLIGMYEREIAADITAFAERAVCALDIGANDGWYSLYFASRPGIKSVYAFEPVDDLIQKLRANLQLNDDRFARKTTIVPKMVGNQDNDQWCSIDQFFPNLPRPVIFKIDVEGGEMDVLRGASRTLTEGNCLILVETHSLELEQQCQQFLASLGYQTRIIDFGWYRMIFRQGRPMAHNRWLKATRDSA